MILEICFVIYIVVLVITFSLWVCSIMQPRKILKEIEQKDKEFIEKITALLEELKEIKNK